MVLIFVNSWYESQLDLKNELSYKIGSLKVVRDA